MARVKRAVNAQKKRRSSSSAPAVIAVRAAGSIARPNSSSTTPCYSYRDRRAKKGDFRRLWIQRINAGARANGMTYNRFIQACAPPRSTSTVACSPSSRSTMRSRSPRSSRSRRPTSRPPPTPRPAPERSSRSAFIRAPGQCPDQSPVRPGAAVAALARRSARSAGGRFLVEGPQECGSWCATRRPPLSTSMSRSTAGPGTPRSSRRRMPQAASSTTSPTMFWPPWPTPRTPGHARRRAVGAGRAGVRPRRRAASARPAGRGPRPGNLGRWSGPPMPLAPAGPRDAQLRRRHLARVVRSTAGSLFHLPVVTGLDAEATVVALEARGIRTYATEGGAATRLPDVDLLTPTRVMGTEATGLPPALAARCTDHLHPRPRPGRVPQSRHGRHDLPLRLRHRQPLVPPGVTDPAACRNWRGAPGFCRVAYVSIA